MGPSKVISSCFVIIFTLIAILMEHSASGTTVCDCAGKEISITYINIIEDFIEKIKQNVHSGKNDCSNDGDDDDDGNKDCEMQPMDCAEVLRSGHTKSGVYTICPKNRITNGSVDVYCDMDTDGGGWTVIQRRGDFGRSEDYFYKNWKSYKEGFGDIKEDFWLGNDLIFGITNQARYSIRFDLSDFEGNTSYALYDDFWIGDEEEAYRLHISNLSSGNAGDSMYDLNNMKFSTRDRDNGLTPVNCAKYNKGAWWYNFCSYSNLNGLYLKWQTSGPVVYWYHWKRSHESLSTTQMKIRPKSFHKV